MSAYYVCLYAMCQHICMDSLCMQEGTRMSGCGLRRKGRTKSQRQLYIRYRVVQVTVQAWRCDVRNEMGMTSYHSCQFGQECLVCDVTWTKAFFILLYIKQKQRSKVIHNQYTYIHVHVCKYTCLINWLLRYTS